MPSNALHNFESFTGITQLESGIHGFENFGKQTAKQRAEDFGHFALGALELGSNVAGVTAVAEDVGKGIFEIAGRQVLEKSFLKHSLDFTLEKIGRTGTDDKSITKLLHDLIRNAFRKPFATSTRGSQYFDRGDAFEYRSPASSQSVVIPKKVPLPTQGLKDSVTRQFERLVKEEYIQDVGGGQYQVTEKGLAESRRVNPLLLPRSEYDFASQNIQLDTEQSAFNIARRERYSRHDAAKHVLAKYQYLEVQKQGGGDLRTVMQTAIKPDALTEIIDITRETLGLNDKFDLLRTELLAPDSSFEWLHTRIALEKQGDTIFSQSDLVNPILQEMMTTLL